MVKSAVLFYGNCRHVYPATIVCPLCSGTGCWTVQQIQSSLEKQSQRFVKTTCWLIHSLVAPIILRSELFLEYYSCCLRLRENIHAHVCLCALFVASSGQHRRSVWVSPNVISQAFSNPIACRRIA